MTTERTVAQTAFRLISDSLAKTAYLPGGGYKPIPALVVLPLNRRGRASTLLAVWISGEELVVHF